MQHSSESVVSLMDADGLAPAKCQGISNNHDDMHTKQCKGVK